MGTAETAEGTEEWAVLRPQDTVQVRDGRTFNGGEGGAAETVAPWPSTVAGALGALLSGEPECVRGPVLAREFRDGWVSYFPLPADLGLPTDAADPGEIWRLRLETLAGGDGTSSNLRTGLAHTRTGADPEDPFSGSVPLKLEPPENAVTDRHTLQEYLHGTLIAPGESAPLGTMAMKRPVHREERVGIAIDDKRRIRHGALYRATHLRLEDDTWAYAAAIVPRPGRHRLLGEAAGAVRFGGMGRVADAGPADMDGWPEPPPEFPGGRVLVYVATPAVWPDGGIPPLQGLDGGPAPVLAGAIAGRPIPVAISTPKRLKKGFHGSKRLYTAVPPGSLYHLQFPNPDDAAAWARAHHGRALGPAAGERLDTAGFGVILTGVWS